MDLVVSHRSKSPNDDMEAQIALAVNALGLKAGGGANTERLIKYHAVTELMQRGFDESERDEVKAEQSPIIRRIFAYEEPTNAGIPTVGATVEFLLPDSGVALKFKGATPLGTSAGTGEAIHLVDALFERAEYTEIINRHPELFIEHEPGVYGFEERVKEIKIKELEDDELLALFKRVQRYEGKGCLNAIENISTVIAPAFAKKIVTGLTLKDIDQILLSLELHVAERRGKINTSTSVSERIHVMQRKQNLGMNAMLSVSLAMARGLAHLKGQDLYEILREEMLAIIEKLARMNEIKIKGSRITDYFNALLEVNQAIEAQGKQLHEVLRILTGIYSEAYRDSNGEIPLHAEHLQEEDKATVTSPPRDDGVVLEEEPSSGLTSVRLGALTREEESSIAGVNTELFTVYQNKADNVTRHDALHKYIKVKQNIARRTGRFGIVNNRVFITSDQMFIPYLVGDTLVVFNVHDGISETVLTLPLPNGKIFTDELLKQVAGVKGDSIDLENELCFLEAKRAVPIHVGRIRDFVEHLRNINESANRSEAVYVLRNLVARLSLFSFKKQLNAKNLQSEVHSLFKELKHFINSPISNRLPFLVRILVRDIAAVVTRPKLIDRLWNETISLAEIHVRGSAIVNELRRSTHHAMGRHTLKLASAYLTYLKTGEQKVLEEVGAPELAPADEKARKLDRPKHSVARIIEDLEQLLGSSETIGRIREWQSEYDSTLIRCEFGKNLIEELNAVMDGMRDRNRWVYYHHLRIIKSRIQDFTDHMPGITDIVQGLDYLLGLKPDDPSFNEEFVEEELQSRVDQFIKDARLTYQTKIFNELEDLLTAYDTNEFFSTFTRISQLRKNLRDSLNERAFPEQRLMLLQLDCLLEEMSYLALRQIASQYEEKGVDFAQCLEIIHTCVLSLTHDGLHSRQLHDLAAMLRNTNRTYAEIRNILEQIHRNYHHLVQRVITPFERKREKIGFSEEEIQAALANMKRYMHDLNSIAYFTDIAHSFIETQDEDEISMVGLSAGSAPPQEPFEVIHLSHKDDIKNKVESDHLACNLRNRYGSKGSGLIYISYLNLPTRDGFILPTTLAQSGLKTKNDKNLEKVIIEHLKILEADIAKRDGITKIFGSPKHPLLLAIRGGSVFSMPGILSTLLFDRVSEYFLQRITMSLLAQDIFCPLGDLFHPFPGKIVLVFYFVAALGFFHHIV